MDHWICERVSNSLDIDHYHVSSGDLPRKVAQSLSDESLIGTRLVHPTPIVVLLDIVTLNVVLGIPIFDIFVLEAI